MPKSCMSAVAIKLLHVWHYLHRFDRLASLTCRAANWHQWCCHDTTCAASSTSGGQHQHRLAAA